MKKNLLSLFLGTGWILLALFLLSGSYYKKLTNDTESFFFSPIAWEDHLQLFKGAIQCSLTNEELLERKKYLKDEIFNKIVKKDEIQNGFVYYFNDDPILLNYVLEFIQKEKTCCPFFKFDISILPFNKGFAMKISGSEEALNFLKDFENNEL